MPISLRSRITLPLLGIVCGLLVGCGSPTPQHPRNILAIDADGSLRVLKEQQWTWRRTNTLASASDLSTNGLATGQYIRNQAPKSRRSPSRPDYLTNSHNQVRFIFARNRELNARTNILIYIQGGLNDVDSG